MIFHHPGILTNDAQTDLGIVPQKVFGYDQHLAALRLRVGKMLASMPSHQAAFSCIEDYLDFSPVSFEREEMLEDILHSVQFTAFVTDLRHAWQDVTKSEMQQYFKDLEEAENSIAGGGIATWSQGTLADKLETITLPEFLETLSQYKF